MPHTEVVYVCSIDRFQQLAASLTSLFASGSNFDSVCIYCIGFERPGNFLFADERVSIVPVDSKCPDYFLLNKTYLTESVADRVIFLDTDTLVFRPLDDIWRLSEADIIARHASGGPYKDATQADAWTRLCYNWFGKQAPYFNSGFVIFQNRAHVELRDAWERFTRDGRAGRTWHPNVLHGQRFAEQLALSLAIRWASLSCQFMSPQEQAFGWNNELTDKTYLLHTGNSRHHKLLAKAVRQNRISRRVRAPFAQPVELDLKQPAWWRLWTMMNKPRSL